MIVRLQGNIDDDSRDLQQLLQQLSEIHSTTSGVKWRLKCRECRYLGPWSASVMYAAFLRGKELGQHPKISLPDEPEALKAYCIFSGMSKEFAGGQAPSPDAPECETIPLKRFSEASWNLPDGIIKLLNRHTEVDQEREDQISTCIHEVTQNVVDHAESSIGGVMSARYFEKTAEVRVGIVDRGVGIAAKLKKKFSDTTGSIMALHRVIQGGYSSQSRPNNMGLGVSNLFALVKSAQGRMAVFTGDAVAEVHAGSPPTVQSVPFHFPGTAVFFSLPLTPSRD